MIRTHWKLLSACALAAMLCGIGGVVMTQAAAHLRTDHDSLHAIIKMINDNAEKQRQANVQPRP